MLVDLRLPGAPGSSTTAPPSTTTTTLVEHGPTRLKQGANADSSDFFGIFIAIAVLVIVIVVIRFAFPTARRRREWAEEARQRRGPDPGDDPGP